MTKIGLLALFFLPVIESLNRGAGYVFLFAGALALGFASLRNNSHKFGRIDFFFFLFLAISSISIIYSGSLSRGVPELARYTAYYLIFRTFASSIKNETGFKEFLFNSLLLNSLILSALAAIYYIFGKYLPTITQGMNLFYPIFSHNRIAEILIMTIPLLTLSYKVQRHIKLYVFSLTVFSIMLILSAARGAIASFAAAFTIYSLFISRHNKKLIYISSILLLITINVFFGIMIYSEYHTQINSYFPLYNNFYKPLDWDLRSEYIRQSVEGFKLSPIIGNGLDTFRFISMQFQIKSYSWSWYSHNHIFQLLSDTGILGCISFLVLFSALFHGAVKKIKQKQTAIDAGIFVMILSSTLHSLIDFDWQFLSLFMYVFMGLALLNSGQVQYSFFHFRKFIYFSLILFIISLILIFNDSDRLIFRSEKLATEGKFQSALRILDIAEKLDPKFSEIYKLKYRLFDLTGNKMEADRNLEKALELNPLDGTD